MATCPAQQDAEAHLEEVLWAGQGRCEETIHIQAEALQAACTTSSAAAPQAQVVLLQPRGCSHAQQIAAYMHS